MHIECQKCATKLTPELAWVSSSDRSDKMGEQMLKQGLFTREDGSYFHDQVGVYIAHPEDVINMYLTSEANRIAGAVDSMVAMGRIFFAKSAIHMLRPK